MISSAYKEEFIKRLEGLAWSIAGMVISAVLSFILTEANLLSLPVEIVALVGLGISQLTKFLNVSLPKLRKMEAEKKVPEE